jgi:hypothetical protein
MSTGEMQDKAHSIDHIDVEVLENRGSQPSRLEYILADPNEYVILKLLEPWEIT